MYDVFISFSSENRSEANSIQKFLENKGFSCWCAPTNIHGHEDFSKVIPRAISNSRAFLLLLSDSAQQSVWVQREVMEADAKKVPTYILYLEACQPTEQFQFLFRCNQHYEVSLGRKEQLNRLVRDLVMLLRDSIPGDEDKYDRLGVSKAAPKKKTWIIITACVLAVAVLATVFLLTRNSRRDGSYVIWAPAFDMALSTEVVNTHYHAGEEVWTKDGKLSNFSGKCVWQIDFMDDGTFTISLNGENLGVEPGYNGIGLGGKYTADRWETVSAEDDMVYIRNVETGGYLEWYDKMDNWSTHDKITDTIRDQFLLDMERVS